MSSQAYSPMDRIPLITMPLWYRRSHLERLLILSWGFGIILIFALTISLSVVSKKNQTPTVRHQHCFHEPCVHIASAILRDMNQTVAPCKDMYKFACEHYDDIDDPQKKKTRFTEMQHQFSFILKEYILEGEDKWDHNVIKIVRKLYNTCMHKPLQLTPDQMKKNIADNFGGWPVEKDPTLDHFKNMERQGRRELGLNNIMDIEISSDINNAQKFAIYLNQPSFTRADKKLLEEFGPKHIEKFIRHFEPKLMQIFKLSEDKKSIVKAAIQNYVEFEKALAKIVTPEDKLWGPKYYVKKKIQELPKFPLMELTWIDIFQIAIIKDDVINKDTEIIVQSPTFIDDLAKLLQTIDKKKLMNYFLMKYIEKMVPFLKTEDSEYMYDDKYPFVDNDDARWERCADDIQHAFPDAIGAIFMLGFPFDETYQKRVDNLTAGIKGQFQTFWKSLEWKKDDSKRTSNTKIERLSIETGLLDEFGGVGILKYYDGLVLDESNDYRKYLSTVRDWQIQKKAENFKNNRTSYSKLLSLTKTMSGVEYNLRENRIYIPIIPIEGLFLNIDHFEHINYGTLGVLIARELAYGFIRQYSADISHFDEWEILLSEKLKLAKSSVTEEDKMKLIADDIGLRVAYEAYESIAKDSTIEFMLPGLNYTSSQMFWISYSSSMCSASEPRAEDVSKDSDDLEKLRVWSMQDSSAFRKAFECAADS